MAPPGASSRASDPESRRLWRLAGMGGTLASEIIAGLLIGWGLDAWLGTAPTLLIIGTSTGVIVGMATFIRIALRETRRAGAVGSGFPRIDLADEGDGDDDDAESRA